MEIMVGVANNKLKLCFLALIKGFHFTTQPILEKFLNLTLLQLYHCILMFLCLQILWEFQL
jgi:hypothetical protein